MANSWLFEGVFHQYGSAETPTPTRKVESEFLYFNAYGGRGIFRLTSALSFGHLFCNGYIRIISLFYGKGDGGGFDEFLQRNGPGISGTCEI
jgi:hypothetical protein